MRLAVLAIVLCAATTAHAQAPGQVEPLAPLAQPAQPHKEPGTAVALSIGATALGFVLLTEGAHAESGSATLLGLAGMYVGPTIGVWYGGGTGWVGLASRAAALWMVVHGLELDDESANIDCPDYGSCTSTIAQSNALETRAEWFVYGGLALWGASTVYDFVDAGRQTSHWNREHALTLAPMITPHTTGMAVALRF